MTSNRHLKTAVDDYRLSADRKILLRIANELRYSSLLIPYRRREAKPVFDIYEGDDGEILTPIFTDHEEVERFYMPGEIEVLNASFELCRNITKTSDIEGYVLNPASQAYLLKKDFIIAITDIPKTFYHSPNPYSPKELKDMSFCENRALEDFVQNMADYEELFEMLSKSTLLTLMVSDNDISPFFKDGILDMRSTGPAAAMHIDDVGGSYATIFSSRDRLNAVKTDKFKHVQVVNLSMLVNFVLSEDMDGIILNPSSDDVLIPRQKLLSYSLGFEKYANDERLADSVYYIFEL